MSQGLLDRPTSESPSERRPTASRIRFITAALVWLVVAADVVFWLLPLKSSLWLDETGTFWVIKDGLGPTISRSWQTTVSPFYYLIDLLAVHVGGHNEVAMRIPSVLLMLGTMAFVGLIARRAFGGAAGLIAMATFGSYGTIAFAAIDARPYALALFFVAVSTYILLRWLERPAPTTAVLYVLSVAAALYANYVFAAFFLSHLILVWMRTQERRPLRRAFLFMSAGIALVCAPLVVQLASIAREGHQLSWIGNEVHWGVLLLMLAQPAALLLVGSIIERRIVRREGGTLSKHWILWFLGAWAVLPPLANFLVSISTTVRIFHPRYTMSSLPAVFILVGWAATRIKAPLLGAAVAVAVLLPVAVKPSHEHADDNWRAANAAASALVRGTSEPVLARISFIESKQLDRLDDPQRNGLLLGPVSAYPIAARVELLPYDLNAAGVAYIDDLLDRKLARPNIFVGEFSGGDREYVLGFNRLMYSRGYRIEKALGFGSIVVLSFGRA